MFLFDSSKRLYAPLGGKAMPMPKLEPTLFDRLSREEQPHSMSVLLLILVTLLHAGLWLWILKPTERVEDIKPLKVMEVALLAAPSQKAADPPAMPPKPKPLPPKKTPVKKVVKKKVPDIKKPAEVPKPKPIVEEKQAFASSDLPADALAANPAVKPVVNAGIGRGKPNNVVSGVVPLVRVPPKYPGRAVSRRIEGWVKIEFTISTSGKVTDATVVASQPAEIFDDEALLAIRKWRFKGKIVNGTAVEQRAVQTLQFKLTK